MLQFSTHETESKAPSPGHEAAPHSSGFPKRGQNIALWPCMGSQKEHPHVGLVNTMTPIILAPLKPFIIFLTQIINFKISFLYTILYFDVLFCTIQSPTLREKRSSEM